jgi:hypothetical protein
VAFSGCRKTIGKAETIAMRTAGYIAAGILGWLCIQPAGAQQSQWVEFPARQSRLEFGVPGQPAKPGRGWELQSSANTRARNYQYLWGTPFQDNGAFARLFIAQLTEAASYFTNQPEWQKMETFPEFNAGVVFQATQPLTAKTDGLGSLSAKPFSARGRNCVAFGGLTHTGSTSQLLYGEASASGDTSVRGYYCAAASATLGSSDIPGILQTLRFK